MMHGQKYEYIKLCRGQYNWNQ